MPILLNIYKASNYRFDKMLKNEHWICWVSGYCFEAISYTGRATNGLYYRQDPLGSQMINSYFNFSSSGDCSTASSFCCNKVNNVTNESNSNNPCSKYGMRMPIIRETNIPSGSVDRNYDTCAYGTSPGEGEPQFSYPDGIPSWWDSGSSFWQRIWTATASSYFNDYYWYYSKTGSTAYYFQSGSFQWIVCVLP